MCTFQRDLEFILYFFVGMFFFVFYDVVYESPQIFQTLIRYYLGWLDLAQNKT